MSRCGSSRSLIAVCLVSSFGLVSTAQGADSLPRPGDERAPGQPGQHVRECATPLRGRGVGSDTGRYEFDVYRVPIVVRRYRRTRPILPALACGVDLRLRRSCAGSLESGDLSVSGTPLEFAFPDCFAVDAPFLRIVMDCPTPGSFVGGLRVPSVQECWSSGDWMEESYPLQCDVGDWCGRLPNHACDWCSMQTLLGSVGRIRSPEFELHAPSGQIWTGRCTHGATWADCGGAPECGEGYGRCFDGPRCGRPVDECRRSLASGRRDSDHIRPGSRVNTVASRPVGTKGTSFPVPAAAGASRTACR